MRRGPRGEVREEEHGGEARDGEQRVGERGERPLLPLDHHPHRRGSASSGSAAGSQAEAVVGGGGRRVGPDGGGVVGVADEIDGGRRGEEIWWEWGEL